MIFLGKRFTLNPLLFLLSKPNQQSLTRAISPKTIIPSYGASWPSYSSNSKHHKPNNFTEEEEAAVKSNQLKDDFVFRSNPPLLRFGLCKVSFLIIAGVWTGSWLGHKFCVILEALNYTVRDNCNDNFIVKPYLND